MLNGKVALVTGAGRGIGRAISLHLAARGMHVAVMARNPVDLEAVRGEAGADTILCVPGDVAKPADITRVVAKTKAALGPIDLVVNNAGTGEAEEVPIWKADIEDWWRVQEVNLRGPMLMMRAVLGDMVARNSGRVININSLRAVTAIPVHTSYAASKAGLARLTHTVNTGLIGTDVHVFDLSPGRVLTDLVANTSQTSVVQKATPDSWTPIGRVAEVVAAIAEGRLDRLSGRFLHARDDLETLAGRADEIVKNDGRVLRFSPAYPGDPLRYPGEPARR